MTAIRTLAANVTVGDHIFISGHPTLVNSIRPDYTTRGYGLSFETAIGTFSFPEDMLLTIEPGQTTDPRCALCGERLGNEDRAETADGIIHAGCFDFDTMEVA